MPRRRFDLEQTPTTSDLVIRSGLPPWIITALRQAGIKRLSVMSTLSDERLLTVPGIGRRAVSMIRQELQRQTAERGEPARDASSFPSL